MGRHFSFNFLGLTHKGVLTFGPLLLGIMGARSNGFLGLPTAEVSFFFWVDWKKKNNLETLKTTPRKQPNNVVERDNMRHYLVFLVDTHIGESICHLVTVTECMLKKIPKDFVDWTRIFVGTFHI